MGNKNYPLCPFCRSDADCPRHKDKHVAKESKPKKAIAKKSDNKIQVDKELKKMYPVFLAEKLFICEIKSPECTGTATVIHHMRGRIGDQVFVIEDWMASCPRCNGFVEDNDAWAREKGFKLNQHSNN